MTEAQTDSGRTFQTLRFSVPSRSFAIEYEVLKDRFLPLVEEFLLRTVATTGGLDPKVAAQFLGLSERECSKCLERLEFDGLMAYDTDGRLQLTAHAIERMKGQGGIPRFVEVESRQARFAVDLISFQSGPSNSNTRDRWFKHSFEAERRPDKNQRPTDRVRAAFEASFYEAKRGKAGRSASTAAADSKEKLHRVQSVLGRQYFNWAFETDIVLWLEQPIRTDFPFAQYAKVADAEARRELFAAIRASVARMVPPPGPTALPNFEPLLAGTPAQGALRGGRLDESFLIELGLAEAGEKSDTAFFVGDFTQIRTRQLWTDRLKASLSQWKGGPRAVPSPLLWLPPEGGLWARSDAVQVALDIAEKQMADRDRDLVSVLLVPLSMEGSSRTFAPQRHKDIFTVARSVNAHRWPPNVEVVLVPDRLATVIFHMRPTDDCVVPVVAGFVTSDPERIAVLENLMASSLDPGVSDSARDWCDFEHGLPDEVARAMSKVMWEGK